MVGGKSASSGVSTVRKRVEAQAASLKRARDGSAFVRCEECNKDVAAALISMHNCSTEAKLKSNLESLVVESQNEIKKKPKKSENSEAVPKKKEKKSETSEAVPKKKEKKPKDLTKPKRPPTAFFVFMDDFRKTFKEEHPDNKSVAVVGKEGGVKWKSLTDEEKKPYIDKAAELKAEYEKNLKEQREEPKDDEEEETKDTANEGDSHVEEADEEPVKPDVVSDDE